MASIKQKIRDQDEEVNFNMSKAIHNYDKEQKDLNVVKEILSMTSKPWHASNLLTKLFQLFLSTKGQGKRKRILLCT